MDARHDLSHDPSTEETKSTVCLESYRYKQLVGLLTSALPVGRQVIDLMKTFDSSDQKRKEVDLHPVTNGSGHGKLWHTINDETKFKEGKCIDYVFFSPNFTIDQLQLQIVPENTHVNPCSVFDSSTATDSKLPSATKAQKGAPLAVVLPISHLSDHYGLQAEFLFHPAQHAHELQNPTTPHSQAAGAKRDAAVVRHWYEILQTEFPHHVFAQTSNFLWRWKLWTVLTTGAVIVAAIVAMLLHFITQK